MDLTTELLDNAAFHAAKRGGYSTQDVDEFIEQVKASVERSDAELRELRQRVLWPFAARGGVFSADGIAAFWPENSLEFEQV